MDNATIHHVEDVIDLIEQQAKAKIIFLPPYSPDLNPVEIVFSKVKGIMKANDAIFQVCSSPRDLLSMAFGTVQITCKVTVTRELHASSTRYQLNVLSSANASDATRTRPSHAASYLACASSNVREFSWLRTFDGKANS